VLWLNARLSAAEVPLAIEPETTALQSIGRIWELTKGNVWRIVLILFITACITLPIQLIAQFLSNAAELIVRTVVPQSSASDVALQVLTLLLVYLMSFALGIALLPLWQTIKATIYFDLRNRREGLGLELRDRGFKE
jgi:membrane-anchored glycerophosphoryl diester phosphodiesterase (GDPDase)